MTTGRQLAFLVLVCVLQAVYKIARRSRPLPVLARVPVGDGDLVLFHTTKSCTNLNGLLSRVFQPYVWLWQIQVLIHAVSCDVHGGLAEEVL